MECFKKSQADNLTNKVKSYRSKDKNATYIEIYTRSKRDYGDHLLQGDSGR